MTRQLRAGFRRNATILVSAGAIAQAVDVLATPIVSRVYAVPVIGGYGSVLALSTVLSALATARLERGLVLDQPEEERRGLLGLIMTLAVAVAITATIVTLVWSRVDNGQSEVGTWFLMSPFIMLLGWSTALESFALQRGAFYRIGAARLAGALVSGLLKVVPLFGAPATTSWLLTASMSGLLVTVGVLWPWAALIPISSKVLRTAWRRNRWLARDLLPASALNTASGQLPLLVVTSLLGKQAAGFFFLAMRVTGKPLSVIVRGVSDAAYHEAQGHTPEQLKIIYVGRVRRLALGAVAAALCAAVVAPFSFGLVFGSQWKEAGVLAALMAPGLAVQFVFTPFSSYFTVLRATPQYVAWAAGRVVVLGCAIILGGSLGGLRWAAAGLSVALIVSFLAQHMLLLRAFDSAGSRTGTTAPDVLESEVG